MKLAFALINEVILGLVTINATGPPPSVYLSH